MNTSVQDKNDNLPLIKVVLLVFIPTTVLTVSYFLLGYVQQTIPSLLLFFVLAMLILFPIELGVIFCASKRIFGNYSLRSAFINQEKVNLKKALLLVAFLFGFTGIVVVTVGSFENRITTPVSIKLSELMPLYFDWNNLEYLRQYPKNMLILTSIVYALLNVIVGPIVEELYFRGYLTSQISRFGKWSPVIITVLFSLYHLWLPLQNVFRIFAFLPAAYIAWKNKNIYISMAFHCLCNIFSTISFIVTLFEI